MGLFSGPFISKEEHESAVHLNLISRINSLEFIAYEQGVRLQVAQARIEELEAGEPACFPEWVEAKNARIAELEAQLKTRDAFIVDNSLWMKFVSEVDSYARKALGKGDD